jgi:hypothetical protein
MSHIFALKGLTLCKAIKATFERRKTEIPSGIPIAFTSDFQNDPDKQSQWAAFLTRNELSTENIQLPAVIEQLKVFLLPPAHAVSRREEFTSNWPKGGPWKSSK